MVTEYWSGHIPAFGEWENYTNIVPSTRHFECRYEPEHTVDMMYTTTVGFHKPLPPRVLRTAPPPAPQPKETVRGTLVNKGCRSTCKEPRRRAANQQHPFTRNQSHYYYSNNSNDIVTGSKPAIANLTVKVKPVDEDLYKISPELLKKSNSKKILGFFSRCMFPMCSA